MPCQGLRTRQLKIGDRELARSHSYVICPYCGGKIRIVNRLGRKPLGISVKNICDTLRECCDVGLAAEKLGCSRGYIYQQLAKQGTKPREVIDASR